MKKIITGLIVLIIVFVTNVSASQTEIIAKDGQIDLTNVIWKDNLFELTGEWDFYWKQFIVPQSTSDSLSAYKKLTSNHPGPWTKTLFDGTHQCSADGFGTYRLRIKVPNENRVYGLKVHSIFTAYKLYVNGKYIDGLGTLGKNKEESKAKFLTKEIPIPVSIQENTIYQELDIVIQVSNFDHRRAGMQQLIAIGEITTVINKTRDTLILNLLLIGIIIIIGLNHILMYVLRRLDISNLLFGILSMIMVLRNITTGERIIMHMFPNLNWEMLVRLDNFSGFGTISLFAFYFYMSYRKDFPKVMFYIIMGIGVLITALVFSTNAWFYGKFRMLFEVYIGLGGLYLVFGVLLVAAIRKRSGGFITFLGMFLLYGTAINDVLSSMGLIKSAYIAPYGIAAFMILQSYLHTRKSAHALKDNQNLSEELKQEKVTLEERISVRTKELSSQADELGKYRIVQEKQNWINESLNAVTEVMRQNKDDLEVLADQLLSTLVKKVSASMGAMYLLSKVEGEDKLKLLANFGLSKEGSIEFLNTKEGMVGKCFSTGKEEFITDLPDDYFVVSSGLGSSKPALLAIMPMKIDEMVIGVVEIATFKEITDVHKEFLRKTIVNIAAQLNIVKLNSENQQVLEEYKGYKIDLQNMQEDFRKLQEELFMLKEQK
ncbi:MAG: GAF domain-containing protein [Salinivirgaceae bacterium]|nr:GAF domain-containing protein [Salinivirgaceae bacterium]